MGRDALLAAAVVGVGLSTVPSHDAFVTYLLSSRSHPAGWAGAWASMADSAMIPLLASSTWRYVLRTGVYKGRHFLGALGCWVPLPSVSSPLSLCSSWLCATGADGDSWGPQEAVIALCVAVFALWHVLPEGFMWRHFTASPSGLAQGRVWTLLTANVSHCHLDHLVHNCICLLSAGPVVAAGVPCAAFAELLLAAALASSVASLAWAHYQRRRGATSLGASGLCLAVSTASAVTFPRTRCILYGLELPPAHAVLVQIGLDCLLAAMHAEERARAWDARDRAREIDFAAHIGGALCGWWYARHRFPAYRRSIPFFYD